jgi:hypothetical protein
MFPQSVKLTMKLTTLRQAEIRATFAHARVSRRARAAQPSGRPQWFAELLRPFRVAVGTGAGPEGEAPDSDRG